MFRPVLVFLAVLSGCSEPTLRPTDDVDRPPDTDDPDGGVRAGEHCNGLDDDGDGEVDEGWPDSDGDGMADCRERDCVVSLPAGREIPVDPLCLEDPWTPPEDPWNVAVEWHLPTGGEGVVVMPAVGNLTDDNGDGFVDDRDIPEIVFTVYWENVLRAVSGDTGEVLFEVPDIQGTSGVAIADVDRDGDNEIIALYGTTVFSVVAIEADGSIAWQSPSHLDLLAYATPVVADLDGDGDVEVVVDKLVLEGATGEVVSILDVQTGRRSIRSPIIADVDVDGIQEILIGTDRFAPDGTLEYRNPRADPRSVHSAVADVDGDPEGETIMVFGSVLETIDPDGTTIFSVGLPGDNGGPPCVADFDGDGEVEIGLGIGENVGVYELTGQKVWEHRSVDETAAHAGCSGYDFDGDGDYELLHADQHTFYIFDGGTGEILYANASHTSTTIFEYPVVADVDHDGAAEIVLASNTDEERSGWAGITVFGHASDGWARSGPTWGVHDFAVTNLDGDGQVPTRPTPPWQVHNVFRARPNVDTPALPNLQIRIEDMCVGTCEGGPVRVSYIVSNEGGAPVREGTRLTTFVVSGPERTPIASRLLPALPPGTELPAFELVLQPWELRDALLFAVDDDGRGRDWVDECHEDDNIAVLEYNPCVGR